MQKYSFYHQHLELVSRSFSFCITTLTSPAREWVALSYLLLRVVDTIEDSPWDDETKQFESFALLKSYLIKTPSVQELKNWAENFPAQIPEAEQALLMDLPLLLTDLNEFPQEVKEQITGVASQMIDGMSYFLREYKKELVLRLPSLAAVNQYCFFVAGIVGQLLTYLFTRAIDEFSWTEKLLNQSIHFGLFLQKINLLKDKKDDEHLGRYYLSSREQVRQSLEINALHAMNCLIQIPIISGRTCRLAIAWSLFIGLASLRWIDKNEASQEDAYKINLKETSYIIKQISELIDDNEALIKLFNTYLPEQAPQTIYSEQTQLPNCAQVIHSSFMEFIDWQGLGMLEELS